MCWSRWHPLNFHPLGTHPRGDGNLLGQLHGRKGAISEQPGLSTGEKQPVGLLRAPHIKAGWEGGAVRAGGLLGQQRVQTRYGKQDYHTCSVFIWGHTFLVTMQSLTLVILGTVDHRIGWTRGIATFQILNTCGLDSPFTAHPCQHFPYFFVLVFNMWFLCLYS